MKKVLFVLAVALMVSCNTQPTTATEVATTDSTVVATDTCTAVTADSTVAVK